MLLRVRCRWTRRRRDHFEAALADLNAAICRRLSVEQHEIERLEVEVLSPLLPRRYALLIVRVTLRNR